MLAASFSRPSFWCKAKKVCSPGLRKKMLNDGCYLRYKNPPIQNDPPSWTKATSLRLSEWTTGKFHCATTCFPRSKIQRIAWFQQSESITPKQVSSPFLSSNPTHYRRCHHQASLHPHTPYQRLGQRLDAPAPHATRPRPGRHAAGALLVALCHPWRSRSGFHLPLLGLIWPWVQPGTPKTLVW